MDSNKRQDDLDKKEVHIEPNEALQEVSHLESETESAQEVLPETSLVDTQDSSDQQVKPKHRSKKLLIIMVILLVLLLLVGGGVYWWYRAHHSTKNEPSIAPVVSKSVAPSADQTLERFTNPTTGEEWYGAPKELADQGYHNNQDGVETTYYEVGTRGNNVIIMSDSKSMYSTIELFEKAPDGKVTFILQPDANQKADDDTNVVSSIVRDSSTHYDSLTPPNKFPVNNEESASVSEYAFPGSLTSTDSSETGENTTVVKAYGSSKLVKIEHPYVDTKLTTITYALTTPLGTRMILNYSPTSEDLDGYYWDNDVVIKSNNGNYELPSSTIHGIVRGCGSIVNSVSRADDVSDNDFVVVGTNDLGQQIYTFKDDQNTIVQKAYSEYVEFQQGNQVPTKDIVSFDTFKTQHGIIAFKDAGNEWLIYTRDSYAEQGGCAKPVVYLYPTKTTKVSVRVGADVKVSDPFYDPLSGWDNVIAHPDGKLMVNGKTYDSLFWEGPGQGLYPAVTGGLVVPRSQVVATIRSQLAQQGLTQKETNDFVAYWQDKIPNKQFVRLTWFNTAQMNQLAPLQITPKPDTLIRVFLDMSGLDQPIQIPAQQFVKTARSGFSVVEWGGLAHARLY